MYRTVSCLLVAGISGLFSCLNNASESIATSRNKPHHVSAHWHTHQTPVFRPDTAGLYASYTAYHQFLPDDAPALPYWPTLALFNACSGMVSCRGNGADAFTALFFEKEGNTFRFSLVKSGAPEMTDQPDSALHAKIERLFRQEAE